MYRTASNNISFEQHSTTCCATSATVLTRCYMTKLEYGKERPLVGEMWVTRLGHFCGEMGGRSATTNGTKEDTEYRLLSSRPQNVGSVVRQ